MRDFRTVGVAYRELIFGLTALVNDAHYDDGLLDRLLRLGGRALGATGMTVCEIERDGSGAGRIVATIGVDDWSLGRPVCAATIQGMLKPTPPPYRVELGILEPMAVRQLEDRAACWILMHPVYVDSRLTALLAAFFGTDQDIDQDQTAVMKLIAASIGLLYRTNEPPRTSAPAPADDSELFMAVTSHEIRTPVAVIKGYADTLRDHWDQLDEQHRRESARVIGQRADELARMVDRLLNATLNTHALEVERRPFDLLETLHRAAAGLPLDLRKRLRLELPGRLPPALGHRLSIASVLTELVTNAHKYSPGAAPVLLTAASDGYTVLFRVADRGIGVAPDHTPNTFERFWQGEVGDDRRYGGAGLGLFLVRKTIERQNGWVSLRPRDGGGTVAEVRLPRGDVGVGEA